MPKAKRRTRKPKIDIHLWRMEKIIDRINEHNDRRHEWVMSGRSGERPGQFREWEAEELKRQSDFEKSMENAVP